VRFIAANRLSLSPRNRKAAESVTEVSTESLLLENAITPTPDRWGTLILRAAQGDSASFTTFVQEAERPLWRFVRMLVSDQGLVDEIVSEGISKIWANREKYDTAKGSGRTWVYRVIRNLVKDLVEREDNRQKAMGISFEGLMGRLRAASEVGPYEPEDVEEASPAEQLIRREQNQKVYFALFGLKEVDRLAICMFHFDQMNYEEIAPVLGVTVKALGPRLTRARAKLREILEALS